MGASSSREQELPAEQREAESLAASMGALPMLRQAFSALSDRQTKSIPVDSLQECFALTIEGQSIEATELVPGFPEFVSNLGSCIVDHFFLAEKGGITWIAFLNGFIKCCGRSAASNSLNNLFRLFAATSAKADLPANLHFESDDDECKMRGSLSPTNVLMLLWMCWVMSWDSKYPKKGKGKADRILPDINHLVLSAVVSCAERDGGGIDAWSCNVLDLHVQLPSGKIHLWVLRTVPNLVDCFAQFVYARLRNSTTCEDKPETSPSSACDISSPTSNSYLLTRGRAWSISLTLRNEMREEILKACFYSRTVNTNENLLYRSSLHGKGLNRFWSNVEGYNAPLLILIAACTHADDTKGVDNTKRWIIGALCHQGFVNADHYYGTSGSLCATSPVFNLFSSLGKENNYVYSHLHATTRVYEPHPKPVGIAFGGSLGNERVFMDEDFSKITIRHHATDKTYQHGPLCPDQGFLPLEALVLEVEVWGLGGKTAKDVQTSYKKREDLFTEQRRRVDLKTFGDWEDAPEKMMMDMIADPNRVRREDR